MKTVNVKIGNLSFRASVAEIK